MARIIGEHRRVQGAGRTDSGVHALGQVAHVDVPDGKAGLNWQAALNHHLPHDMAVVNVAQAAPDFHARYHAVSKAYFYTLWMERSYVLPQRSHYVWPVGSVDIQAMRRAAAHLTGKHDFDAFQNKGSDVKTTVRDLLEIRFTEVHNMPELVLRFHATGFLKQMVRNLVGCLAAVGKGRLDPDRVPALLEGRDRTQAPQTAPALGLTLESVYY